MSSQRKLPLILVGEDRDLPRNEEQARALVTASRASERDHLFLSAETFEKRPGSVLAHELTHQFLFELLPQADRDAPWVSEALADHHGGLWTPPSSSQSVTRWYTAAFPQSKT